MILVSWAWAKKKLGRLKIQKHNRLLLPPTSLASVESLAMPPAQDVVLGADLRCTECQERVADIISRMDDMESMVVHVLDKKVTFTHKSVSKGPLRKVAATHSNPPRKVSRIVRFPPRS